MIRRLLDALLFLPSRAVTPPSGIAVEDLRIATEDGELLHGWWVPAAGARRGHVLLCHGNAGNVTSRIAYARLLTDAGFDVLLFDYRGYGRSSGRPGAAGTHADARAARTALLGRAGVQPGRVLYLGESLGAAVAIELALECPPAGVILQSAFTGVRDLARLHYPFLPRRIVPDAYPSLDLIRGLRAPKLLLHGARDDIVPVSHGEALFAAAPPPKRLEVLPAGHNDLLVLAADRWISAVSGWAEEVLEG